MSLVISVHLDLQNILLSGQVLKRGEGCFGASEPPKGAANDTLCLLCLWRQSWKETFDQVKTRKCIMVTWSFFREIDWA